MIRTISEWLAIGVAVSMLFGVVALPLSWLYGQDIGRTATACLVAGGVSVAGPLVLALSPLGRELRRL